MLASSRHGVGAPWPAMLRAARDTTAFAGRPAVAAHAVCAGACRAADTVGPAHPARIPAIPRVANVPRMTTRPPSARVLLAGATGLIGSSLVQQLLERRPLVSVHALVRRVPADADPRVHWQVVDFMKLPALPKAQEAYCCLGTTIRLAGSQAAFRAVDFDAVLAFARAVRAAGVQRFGVVSSLGASPRAASFYSRVKGEMEQAVGALGFAQVVIARPSLLAGDRDALGQPTRLGERLALRLSAPFAALLPKGVRPIEAATVARGLLAAMQQARPGVRIVESGELQQMEP